MAHDLGATHLTLKSGQEKFQTRSNLNLGLCLLDFWSWSVSDLLSNATRGILAEFIVGMALKIEDLKGRPRDEWQEYDLQTSEGIKVEVKSAAFLQSWEQKKLSLIQFSIAKKIGWDREINQQGTEKKRHANVYVFALLGCEVKNRVDPLDLDQWVFYVLPVCALNHYQRSQHSITLNSLRKLSAAQKFDQLEEAVRVSDHIQKSCRWSFENNQDCPGAEQCPHRTTIPAA